MESPGFATTYYTYFQHLWLFKSLQQTFLHGIRCTRKCPIAGLRMAMHIYAYIIYHDQCSHIMNSISSDLFHLYVIGVRERSKEKCLVFQAVWLHVISAAFKPTHAWCHLGKSASGQLKQSRNIQRLKSPISSCSTFPSLELLGKNQDALK